MVAEPKSKFGDKLNTVRHETSVTLRKEKGKLMSLKRVRTKISESNNEA